jgi:multisubunit Na+/H+ antiporter MnhC subunit
MRLPTPIYERAPQYWLLLGLLFMASGVFLGFEYWLSYVYLGVGMICVAWSIYIVVMRARHRGVEETPVAANDDSAGSGTPA